jgi:hypothetical protein
MLPGNHLSHWRGEGIGARGWSSTDAIEPYLAAPTEENIIDSMSVVAL